MGVTCHSLGALPMGSLAVGITNKKYHKHLVTLEVPSPAALSINCNSMHSLHVFSKP